jgi:hypothetical protein
VADTTARMVIEVHVHYNYHIYKCYHKYIMILITCVLVSPCVCTPYSTLIRLIE